MYSVAGKNTIPLSEPLISGNEWKYVKDCLDTGWVSSSGEYVKQFEKMTADYVGTKYAVAVVNGTAAIHLSLIATGVQPEDEVIVPTLTFIAPVNTVRYCGAEPIFMDCDPDTLCMSVQKLSDFLNKECRQGRDGYLYNKKSKKRIKAVIPVHVFGHPVAMNDLKTICGKHGINIIEDATESLGSEYKGKKTGSFGAAGCFSFNGNKIITTGGGGMVVTNNSNIAKKVKHLSTQAKKDHFEYDHDEIGYNYRLTNTQAAMGVAQMERIQEFVNIKRRNASIYSDLLSEVEDVKFMWENTQVKSNFWFYTIKAAKKHKKKLINYLLSKNIQVRPVWKLIHVLPMYKGSQTYRIENAVEAYDTCINIPCSLSLSKKEIGYVSENIRNYFSRL